MFGYDTQRKTIGGSTVRTPTRSRMTDVPMSSVKKTNERAGTVRMSLGQNSGRRTSFFQKTTTPASRDIRGLMNENVAKIHTFLEEHEGEDALSEKQIRKPNGRSDFVNLFELLFQHLNSNYVVPQGCKLEDEIIPLLKNLGYPCALKPSHFQPIGSGHGYPYLIDALAWLVDLIRSNIDVSNKTDQIFINHSFDQFVVKERTVFYSYMQIFFAEVSENRTLMNDPNFIENRRQKLRDWLQTQDDFEEQAEALRNAEEQFNFECEELCSDKGREQQYRDNLQTFENDFRKANEYKNSVEACLLTSRQTLTSVSAENEEIKQKLQLANDEVQALKNRIEEQNSKFGISGESARKLTMEIANYKDILQATQNKLEEVFKEKWSVTNKAKNAFKKQIASYENLLSLLKKAMSGLVIDIEPFGVPENETTLDAELKRMDRVGIPLIKEKLNAEKIELDCKLSRAKQSQNLDNEKVEIEKEKNEEMKKEQDRINRTRKREREEWKEERCRLEKELDQLQNEKEILTEKIQEIDGLDKQISDEQKAYVALCDLLNNNIQELENRIQEKAEPMVQKMIDMEIEIAVLKKNRKELLETVETF
ncbi:unnamed protein product [Caenorhabditis bovis]|uniref:Kinetochore protein NDC80 n=1 Tax=Caenorhabditis bovis TaxID=2654633 RepID=A0A8S1EEZ1_9PELO|nr:unnamed protein product [Caenorhabditis bovis]